jgi:elongation factor G
MRGKEQIPVKVLHAGDIGTVAKLAAAGTGDTLGDKAQRIVVAPPTYPNALYAVAVLPKTQADSTKMGASLTRLSEEDPTLSWHQEGSTNQTILQGMGDQHIDVAIRKAEAKFQVGLLTETPRVSYRETITRKGAAVHRHKKQTGGAGQFAEVHMRVEPLPEENFEFVNEVFGGAISHSFMPAIEKGVRGVLKSGVLAGYPVENVLVAVTDGKEHPVDTKAVAFETAGREAFKAAFKRPGRSARTDHGRMTVPREHGRRPRRPELRGARAGDGVRAGPEHRDGQDTARRDAALHQRTALDHRRERRVHHVAFALRDGPHARRRDDHRGPQEGRR